MKKIFLTIAMIAIAGGIANAQSDSTTVDFSSGTEGWVGTQANPDLQEAGGTTINPMGGNPGAFFETDFFGFGVEFSTDQNTGFLGDYTVFDEISVSVDVQVESILFGPPGMESEVSRNFVLELRNFDIPPVATAFTSVFLVLDEISAADFDDWTTLGTTFDPNSIDLPPGWGGMETWIQTSSPLFLRASPLLMSFRMSMRSP